MRYAISVSPDPKGSYYRYEFNRPLFPDYPRPAIWLDGYYVPTTTPQTRSSRSTSTLRIAAGCCAVYPPTSSAGS